jgi:Calcineurin-like phosphoesterase
MTKAKSELKKHKPANKPESLLVIGDPHSVPDHKCNLEIAELIGKFVAQTNPSLVWCAGDLATFNSLSSYDKGKQASVGRTYGKDVAMAVEWQDRFRHFADKSPNRPIYYLNEGNHEHRIHVALDLDNTLVGALSYSDLQFDKYWNHVCWYSGATPGVLTLPGTGLIAAHFFTQGNYLRAVAGLHTAATMNRLNMVSSIQAHSHLYDHKIARRADGQFIQGLVAGCVICDRRDKDGKLLAYHDWAGAANETWWRGICYLTNLDGKGGYDLSTVRLSSLRKMFT